MSAIVRVDMPWWEAVIVVAEIFAIGWLLGATIAAVYNLGAGRSPERGARGAG